MGPELISVAVVAIVAIATTALAIYLAVEKRPAPDARAAATDRGSQKTSLYCEFYVFVESRPFVAFLLKQAPGDADLFRQVYVAKADGDRTDYNALADRLPEWRLDRRATPQRLKGRVTVPDAGPAGLAEEEIAIELPDSDATRPTDAWREASLKSVYYQNLPGKCRRTSKRAADQRSDAGGASSAATILPTEASRSFTASVSDFVRI